MNKLVPFANVKKGLLAAGASLLLTSAAESQVVRTWVGTSASMNVAANWSPAGVPAVTNGDSIVFSGSSAQNSPTFPYNVFNGNNGLGDITMTSAQITNLTVTCAGGTGSDVVRLLSSKRLAIEAGAGAFTMGASGNTFYLNLGNVGTGNLFVNDSTNLATLGNRITLNASGGSGGRAIFAGSGDWRVDASLSGAVTRGLVMDGSGILTLTAANLFTGGAIVSNGTVRVANASALAAGAVTVEASGALDLAALPDEAAVTNVISGAGTLRVRGGQAVALHRLSPAALHLSVDAAGLSLGSHTVMLRAGTTFGPGTFASLELANADGVEAAFDYSAAGALKLTVTGLPGESSWDGGYAASNSWSAAENWAGDAAPAAWARLAFAGADTPWATNVNDWAGVAHSLRLADQNWRLAGGALSVGAVALESAHAAAIAAPLTFVGDAQVTVAGGGALTLAGEIRGERGFTKRGAGALSLTAPSAYATGTRVEEGTLKVGNSSALGLGAVTFAGDSDLEIGFNSLTLTNRLVVPAGVTARIRRYQATSSTAYFNGGLSGGGALEVGGQFSSAEFGTRLNGSNAGFTGTLRIGAFADVRIEDNATQMGSFLPAGTLELNGGTLQFDINAIRTNYVGNLTCPAPSGSSVPTIRANQNKAHTLSVGALSQDGSFAGRILDGAGRVGLNKVGSATLTLSGGQAYSGPTVVESGALRLVQSDSFPAPLGYWPMSEGSGSTLTNTVAGGPGGTLNPSTNLPIWVQGPGGPGTYAVWFNGTNQWGAIETSPYAALHNVGSGTLTVSAWVKTATAGAWYRSLVSKYNDVATTAFWGLGWNDASQLGFVARNVSSAKVFAGSGAAALDNAWHHLVGVREADNTLRIYLDGALYASAAGPAGVCRDERPIWICRHSSYVTAAVAGVGVWDQPLTAAQVRALYVSESATALEVAPGAAARFVGGSPSIGSLGDRPAGGGAVVLEGASLSVGRNGANTTFSGAISGAGSVTKLGAGTFTLAGSCSVTGTLAVAGGTFAIGAAGSLGAPCTNVVVRAGTLALASSDAISDDAAVRLSGSGKVELAAGVTEVVGTLMINGVRQSATTYGSSASGAAVKNDAYFAGSGMLRLIPVGALMLVQ
jgi:autotransporter-associated beta strand protein